MSDDNLSTDDSVDAAKALLNHEVTPSQLMLTLEHALSTRQPDGKVKDQANVMVWGAMGIGKSDVCRSLGKLWGMRIVSLHLPQFDPTDIKGIPVLDKDGSVRWVPSSYLPQFKRVSVTDSCTSKEVTFDWPSAEFVMVHVNNSKGKNVARFNDQMSGELNDAKLKCDINVAGGKVVVSGGELQDLEILVIDKALLFLDELSAAVPEVQNAALQMVLDKRVGEYDVPPFTPLVAAGNRESDQAFVSPMSMPLCNRFMHLRLIPSLDDWMEWAMLNRVHPDILGYLQWKKSSRLFHFAPDSIKEGDCGFPTPRSWAMLSDQLYGIENLPEVVQNATITGFVGRAVGSEFIEHRKVSSLLPSTDDILRGKDVKISDDLNVGARYGLATALCYALKDYHDRYYDESLGSDSDEDVAKQPKEWRTATKAFCDFVDNHLGSEMTVLCVHITSRHLGISYTKFRGTQFVGFAKKYRTLLQKSV